jgi:mannitol/fructose-specific phosphotransferase system IIA component (Ntr-type)
MAVVLADVLDERHVTLALQAQTCDAALREIAGTMAGVAQLRDVDRFVHEVRVREQSHSTLVGNGVAFPHSRTELVEGIVLGIARSSEGIPWDDTGARAHLIFLIAVPRRLATSYLMCIGALARITRDDAKREQLMAAATAAQLIELLREASLELA